MRAERNVGNRQVAVKGNSDWSSGMFVIQNMITGQRPTISIGDLDNRFGMLHNGGPYMRGANLGRK